MSDLETSTIDRLFLELSQFTQSITAKELALQGEVARLTAENEALKAERDALRKDAERYRWLRDVAVATDWEDIGFRTTPTTTDAYIDAIINTKDKP
jgi:hypothetical protein